MKKRKKANSEFYLHALLTTQWSIKPHWHVLAAVFNANIHSEWFILINLDQSVTKQATAILTATK